MEWIDGKNGGEEMVGKFDTTFKEKLYRRRLLLLPLPLSYNRNMLWQYVVTG